LGVAAGVVVFGRARFSAHFCTFAEKMDFRRSGQLDGRRRRVLMDTAPASDADNESPKPSSGAKAPVRAYAPAVLDERQRTTADFIPKRPFMLLMLALLGLTAIASVEGLYIHLYGAIVLGRAMPGVDLTQPGNLADWLSSTLLLLGALGALAVCSIRVHRIDDYRGRYRIWYWVAAALVWLSIDTATGIHRSLNALCLGASGVSEAGIGAAIWMIAYGLIFGALAVRLACEVWPSIEAFATLSLAATLYVLSAVCELGLLSVEGVLLNTVMQTTVLMTAHGLLVYSLALFARHVYLDAEGRLLVSAEKTSKKKSKSRAKLSVVSADDGETSRKKKTTEKAAGKSEGDSSTSETRPAGASISAATLKSPPAAKPVAVADDDEDDESHADGKLSRAERRKLKKLERREERRAA
jgi:hypothetical protein